MNDVVQQVPRITEQARSLGGEVFLATLVLVVIAAYVLGRLWLIDGPREKAQSEANASIAKSVESLANSLQALTGKVSHLTTNNTRLRRACGHALTAVKLHCNGQDADHEIGAALASLEE